MIYNLAKNEVPNYLKSKYLNNGYRVGGTYKSAIKSLFKFHNETFNAWSILIAIPINTILLYKFNIIKSPFILLWISTVIQVLCSVGNHLFLPLSKKISNNWRKADLISIFAVCPIMTYSFSYFVFKEYRSIILTLLSLCYSIRCIINVLKSDQSCEVNRSCSTIQIGKSVCFYLLPILFGSIYHFIFVSLFLSIGAIFFRFSIPEKYYPNTFDIIGQGQQIMHLTLVIANIIEMYFLKYCYLKIIVL